MKHILTPSGKARWRQPINSGISVTPVQKPVMTLCVGFPLAFTRCNSQVMLIPWQLDSLCRLQCLHFQRHRLPHGNEQPVAPPRRLLGHRRRTPGAFRVHRANGRHRSSRLHHLGLLRWRDREVWPGRRHLRRQRPLRQSRRNDAWLFSARSIRPWTLSVRWSAD